jgi:hypothetical protein
MRFLPWPAIESYSRTESASLGEILGGEETRKSVGTVEEMRLGVNKNECVFIGGFCWDVGVPRALTLLSYFPLAPFRVSRENEWAQKSSSSKLYLLFYRTTTSGIR